MNDSRNDYEYRKMVSSEMIKSQESLRMKANASDKRKLTSNNTSINIRKTEEVAKFGPNLKPNGQKHNETNIQRK